MIENCRRKRSRRKCDEIIHNMVHNLSHMAPHVKAINDYINLTASACPARKSYKKLVEVYEKVIEEGGCYLAESGHEQKIPGGSRSDKV